MRRTMHVTTLFSKKKNTNGLYEPTLNRRLLVENHQRTKTRGLTHQPDQSPSVSLSFSLSPSPFSFSPLSPPPLPGRWNQTLGQLRGSNPKSGFRVQVLAFGFKGSRVQGFKGLRVQGFNGFWVSGF